MFRHFIYNNHTLRPISIYVFNLSFQKKENNGINNSLRESIIGAIINKKVPDEYYCDNKWNHMRTAIDNYIKLLNNKPYTHLKCEHKGGQKNHIDFNFIFSYDDESEEIFCIEFKYNASSIDDAPQFISLGKPSIFMKNTENISYEETFHRDNLPVLSKASGLSIPSRQEYISTINSSDPVCMEAYKSLYKTDITFNELANEQYYSSAASYIEKSELDISLLSKKLRETQNNKHYMLYNAEKGEFALEKACIDDYEIESFTKTKNSYICVCKNGKKLNVLLRWKNNNGIAWPAFQIKSIKNKK